MKWQGRRQSSNVDDRRGARGGVVALGGGGVLILLVVALLFGADPTALLQQMSVEAPATTMTAPGPADEELAGFVRVVLAETEDVWHDLFRREGADYREPTLVLFTDRVQSACGGASSAVGPFYCPGDQQIYIDLSFYDTLRRRFGAPGDFAQAYVLAHEVGHHVQNLMGISEQVHRARSRMSEADYNGLSVRLELQADYFAGVWAHHTRDLLDEGDVDEAIRAAGAIGDDKLQMQAQGYVVPDAFTHGTAEQRVRWFMKGFQSGDPTAGDTFGAATL